MLHRVAFNGFPSGINNFSFGMLFSVIFHVTIFFTTIFALPFVAKKPLELMPIVSVELIQISEKTNIPYAPKAATKPSIAAQPLNFSASGVMAKMKYELNIKKN